MNANENDPKVAFNWFPGHMRRAAEELKERLSFVDLVLEIRDARVPLASGNPNLRSSISGKSRLIVLNKVNLADPVMVAKWDVWFKSQGEPYLFVNCLEKSSQKTILNYARKIIEEKRYASNPDSVKEKAKIRFMIVGLPNTGKSTLINQFANRTATKTANKPGQTRVQIWVKVDETLELLDTPGIMPPKIEREEHKLWLSAINAIPEGIVEAEEPACFLVKHFLKEKSAAFMARYKLDTFELGLDEALLKIAAARGCIKQKGLPDLERVFKLLLIDFQTGELGKTCFGVPPSGA